MIKINKNIQLAIAYADYVSLIGGGIRTIERNVDVLLNACRDVGLTVNKETTMHTGVGRHRGMVTNEHISITNNSYENCKHLNI